MCVKATSGNFIEVVFAPNFVQRNGYSSLLASPVRFKAVWRRMIIVLIRDYAFSEDRTAEEPRDNVLEPVILTHIRSVNDNIRLFRLNAMDPNHTIKV
jgi:hypothetical protein